jgi:cytochrome d ubiquinol oxidase subunit II
MTPPVDLATVWFILVGVLFTGYAVLDGFDLGVGTLHLLTGQDEHRRILLNAIGPVWDGNEVWLVTGGGALFAAFPPVYATVFSGFYLAFMLLLLGLILRAIAIEFRSKRASPAWRRTWDTCFALGSALSALLIGVALGNIARGVPLGADFEYDGSLLGLLNPYALTVGLTTVALFAMHGAIYLSMKTEGELQDQVRRWIRPSVALTVGLVTATTIMTLAGIPHMTDTIRAYPVLLLIPLAGAAATVNIVREAGARRELRAFLSSCTALACLMALFGVGMYPDLVHSSPAAEHSLTVLNAASSTTTLGIMLVIAVLGVPLVIAYTASIYWVYRGKVRLDASSY